ncbi:MAG: hypothetical protein AAFR96_00405 [Planctomycetota bacterium]
MGDEKTLELTPMHRRLASALEGKSYRWIARTTGIHPETVRRYMHGQSPSIEFVTCICGHLRINPQWLLTGEGPMRGDDVRAHHLAEADPAELLAAIAATLDRLSERVDRLELFVQQLETRISSVAPAITTSEDPQGDGSGPDADAAGRIGAAVAERPRPDDD